MTEPPRVLLADLGQREELIACEQTLGHFHAEHLRIRRLPLAVRATHETKGPPLVRGHFSTFVALQGGDELVDVGHAGKRQARAAVCTRMIGD